MGLPGSSEPTPSDAVEKTQDRPVVTTARKGAEDEPGGATSRPEAGSAPPAPPASRSPRSDIADPAVAQAVEDMKATIDALSKPK